LESFGSVQSSTASHEPFSASWWQLPLWSIAV
jgi:hypothetical protein